MIRVGFGYDVHPFADDADRPLVLGGVTIDGRGLVGHSDADAVCHAVADALLGPAGLPDLGALFPASDDQYRDASSLALLRDVVARVADAGWSVVNVDVVVNAEEPRLAPHLDAIARERGRRARRRPRVDHAEAGRRHRCHRTTRGHPVLGGRVARIHRAVGRLTATLGPPWSASATPSCVTPSS